MNIPCSQNSEYWINYFIKKNGIVLFDRSIQIGIWKFWVEISTNPSSGLVGACLGGHLDAAKLMIEKGGKRLGLKDSKYWGWGLENQDIWSYELEAACEGGHLDIINFLIKKGAKDWDIGLRGACKGGHLDLVNLMIEKGTKNWNFGLFGACKGGHLDIVKLMLQKGAEPQDEYKISFNPKNDQIIEIIYASLYDYLPDEMINEVLKYSIVEDFNLYEWFSSFTSST